MIIGNRARPPPAGAGTPVKKLFVQTGKCCESISVLNRASLSAQHTANSRTSTHPIGPASFIVHKNNKTAGAIPKAKKSERLSSSAPNLLVPLIRRAIRPSKASNTPATIIEATAASHLPSIPNLREVSPAHNASIVKILGIILLKDWLFRFSFPDLNI